MNNFLNTPFWQEEKTTDDEIFDERRKDHISHFILRLAYCRSYVFTTNPAAYVCNTPTNNYIILALWTIQMSLAIVQLVLDFTRSSSPDSRCHVAALIRLTITLKLKTIELLHIGNLSDKKLPRAANWIFFQFQALWSAVWTAIFSSYF